MPLPTRRVALSGSEREPLAGARAIGPADPQEQIQVSVYLKPKAGAQPQARSDGGPPRPMTRAEFADARGADPADIDRVEQFAHDHGLTVVEASIPRRMVRLAGTVAAMSEAFGVHLQKYQHPHGTYRGRTGALTIPENLANSVTAVLGLDNRPQARAKFRVRTAPSRNRPRASSHASYDPPSLAQTYNFPTGLDGSGQTIAIIELGGGYTAADLDTYFSRLNLSTPSVTAVSVDGGANQPAGDPNSADGEVMLDIEVAGGVAQGAQIAVYFAPNTDQGFVDAITTAAHDSLRTPSVISISWGAPEDAWTPQATSTMDAALADAGALGISVFVAAGDNGSTDGETDGHQHVDFPASSANCTACGGTSLQTDGGQLVEACWNNGPGQGATGGGISDVFDLPLWQQNAKVPPSANDGRVGRGVPDIAADADPQTGYNVQVDGQLLVFGGTSAVAPLYAGLLALINQSLTENGGQTAGFLNPVLYGPQMAGQGYDDVTAGNNGSYSAGPGWDPCTGWGSINGIALLGALQSQQGSSGAGPAGGAEIGLAAARTAETTPRRRPIPVKTILTPSSPTRAREPIAPS